MDRVLYTAMNGADQALYSVSVHANNLANAQTTGFRADFNSYLSAPVEGPGFATRTFALADDTASDFTPGAIISTGNPLDFAVQGDGWIGVQADDGSEAYSRDGALQISVNGLLTNSSGKLVLGDGGPIAIPPAQKVRIAADGSISILPLGQAGSRMVTVDRIKLVNPDTGMLRKGDDGLFRTKDGQQLAADASVRVSSGSLEASNVNVVNEMTNIIELSRQFEVQTKLMEAAKKDDQKASEVMAL